MPQISTSPILDRVWPKARAVESALHMVDTPITAAAVVFRATPAAGLMGLGAGVAGAKLGRTQREAMLIGTRVGLATDALTAATIGSRGLVHRPLRQHAPWLVTESRRAVTGGPVRRSLVHTSRFMHHALPAVAIATGGLQAAAGVSRNGWGAVAHQKDARGGTIQATAGALMLVPGPVTQGTAAFLLGASVMNEFDLFHKLDRPTRAPAPNRT